MGSTSRYGRATINSTSPEALGICDRCGFLFNLRDLSWQFDWAGVTMINRQLRVCDRCRDLPQEQLRAIILPPDPPSVRDPRTEPFLVDEVNHLFITKPIGQQFMFEAAGSVTALFAYGASSVVAFDGISNVAAAFMLAATLSASIDGVSDVTCDLELVTPASHLLTEGSDRIVTEGGDSIITET
jgi:hypothetical protein